MPIDITEAAGDWLDRLSVEDVSIEERKMFAGWLRRSPVHIAEFLRVSALHATLSGSLVGYPDWAQELLANSEDRVAHLPLPADAPTPNLADVSSGSHIFSRYLGVAAMLLVIIAASFWVFQIRDKTTITTNVGEQRVVLLEDGSTLQLNTDSEVRVRLRPGSREIELFRGELLVDVAKDPERPFRVRTDNAIVEAIGTRFNVYRRDNSTTEVTVIEGRVSVDWEASSVQDGASSTGGHLELDAGGKTVIAEQLAAPIVSKANIERATAWTERRLYFNGQTVAAVVAEFNRYNRSNIVVDDPALAERRITGVFDVNDPGAFVALLGGLGTVEIEVTLEGHRTLTSKTAQKEN